MPVSGKRKFVSANVSSRKKRKTTTSTLSAPVPSSSPQQVTPADESDDWLNILPLSEKLSILQESYDAGSNAAIKRTECSFCGTLECIDAISSIACSKP